MTDKFSKSGTTGRYLASRVRSGRAADQFGEPGEGEGHYALVLDTGLPEAPCAIVREDLGEVEFEAHPGRAAAEARWSEVRGDRPRGSGDEVPYEGAAAAIDRFGADRTGSSRRLAAKAVRKLYSTLRDRSRESARATSQIRALEGSSVIQDEDLFAWARGWREDAWVHSVVKPDESKAIHEALVRAGYTMADNGRLSPSVRYYASQADADAGRSVTREEAYEALRDDVTSSSLPQTSAPKREDVASALLDIVSANDSQDYIGRRYSPMVRDYIAVNDFAHYNSDLRKWQTTKKGRALIGFDAFDRVRPASEAVLVLVEIPYNEILDPAIAYEIERQTSDRARVYRVRTPGAGSTEFAYWPGVGTAAFANGMQDASGIRWKHDAPRARNRSELDEAVASLSQEAVAVRSERPR